MDIRSDPGGTQIVVVLPVPSEPERRQNEFQTVGHATEQTVGNSDRARATILLIDDEAAGLLPRKLLLESAGYRVIDAQSGAQGLQIFQSEQVDAVILDYWMSGMKGTAVACGIETHQSGSPDHRSFGHVGSAGRSVRHRGSVDRQGKHASGAVA